jgi:hypothetical protein
VATVSGHDAKWQPAQEQKAGHIIDSEVGDRGKPSA